MSAPRRPDEENASPAFLQKQDRFGDHLDQFRRPQKVKLSMCCRRLWQWSLLLCFGQTQGPFAAALADRGVAQPPAHRTRAAIW